MNDMLNKMGTSEEDLKKAIAEQAVRWLLQFLHLVFDSLLTKNRDFHLTGGDRFPGFVSAGPQIVLVIPPLTKIVK